ncbi:head-tail connector protein [Metabacillus halosaccharovorans]|uniref:head-tail connector protein n=1 Tax=Metabacillus halosaccharovorans TaxID=930124 RepID=UPI00203E5566|nr:head-tail connector protein [Metabacillus halosaccharovorans]MCM3444377.1 head-tail connector protein [Metabacillus halosaccharovorans]
MLSEIKLALRITHDALNDEIIDLFEAARHDLMLSGVSSIKVQVDNDINSMLNVDPLIKRAIITYCKANFGYDNPDAERFTQSYQMLKEHLSIAGDYTNAT